MRIETPKLWLPRTGQTTSYADGDDGYFQAGNPRVTRFVDNLNGTVSDRATGLMWVKQPELIVIGGSGGAVGKGNWADSTAYDAGDVVNDGGAMYQCISGHTGPGDTSTQPSTPDAVHWIVDPWTADAVEALDAPALMAWADACANCLALEYAGYTDWRLPNVLEYVTVKDFGAAAGSAWNGLFTNSKTSQYWSSTSSTDDASKAFYVHFRVLYTYLSIGAAVASTFYVRPVRGGRINDNW